MEIDFLKSRIEGEIRARELVVGKGVRVEAGVVITGKAGPADRVVLGDFCYIGRETRIIVPEFRLGDYSKLNAYTFAHGEKPLQIGRNCWLGGNCVLDSLGGLDIDDNVGVGAHSQIWTHIQFGDIVEGSRFHSRKYLHIERDAWLVGHCILSPVRVGEKSMAMAGSVITHDMLPNHIYAGVPARDVTEKMGEQFEPRSIEQKAAKLRQMISHFETAHPQHRGALRIAHDPSEITGDGSWFDLSRRSYTKRYHPAEVAFLKANVPLVKFAPLDEPPFVDARLHSES